MATLYRVNHSETDQDTAIAVGPLEEIMDIYYALSENEPMSIYSGRIIPTYYYTTD